MVSNHIRKTSLPSASHPLLVCVEENLQSLKSSQGTTATHSSLSQQLNSLKNVYESLDDLLQMPFSQQLLCQEKSGKLTEEVLNGSIKLLDMCSAVKDCFALMKEGVKEVESSLRRKRVLENEIGTYMSSKKKLDKMVYKCFKELKKSSEKSCAIMNKDSGLEPLFDLLTGVQEISLTVLESSLSFISHAKGGSKPRISGWSLVSKVLQAKKVEDVNEVEQIDFRLWSLIHKKSETSNMQILHKELQQLELKVEKLEEELGIIFRLLLKTRVSLLNSLNH